MQQKLSNKPNPKFTPKRENPRPYHNKCRIYQDKVNVAIEYAYYDEINIIYRKEMEDAFYLQENMIDSQQENFYIEIQDGHNGIETVQLIEQHMAKIFQEECKTSDSYKKNFEQTYKKMDQIIKEKQEQQDCGSVIFTGLMTKNQNDERHLHYANLGDVAGFIFFNQIEKDPLEIGYLHRVEDDDEKQRIKSTGTEVYCHRIEGKINVSRGFGDLNFRSKGLITDPFLSEVKITNDMEYLIIATDGLLDYIKQREIKKAIQIGQGNTEKIAEFLLNTAIMNKSTDNISIFVMKLN